MKRLSNIAAEGWWSGDLHVHRPVEDMQLLMRAEDLHIAPVITWWNSKNLWDGRPIPDDTLVSFDRNCYYDVMAGEDEREGGALLYFHLKEPLAITGSTREFPSPMKFLSMARKHSGAWVDIEKPFWWDVPIWIASGQVDSIGIANNHMTRDGIYSPSQRNTRPNHTEEAWGKPRDYERLPSPLGNGYWSQEIYYHILDSGIRIPPSAGSASGVLPNPVGYNRVWVHVDGDLTYEKWWGGLRAGRCFVSNGPLLRCKANGRWPGHVFRAEKGDPLAIDLEGVLDSRDPVSAIEVIVNGRVTDTIPLDEFRNTGKLVTLDFEESGWFLVRAIADTSETFRFASTAPWFVEIGETKRRVSKASAQFFLDWVRERRERVAIDDLEEKAGVLQHHNMAEAFWREKVEKATAE